LRPDRATPGEDVGRTLLEVAAGVGAGGAEDGGVSAERDGGAEVVEVLRVVRRQLLLLGPDRAATREDVRRASIVVVRDDVVEVGPDESGVPVDGDGASEVVEERAVAPGQLLLFRPDSGGPEGDIGGALLEGVLDGPGNGRIAVDRDRGAV